ncbi:MAG: hypothetical protein JJE17_07930 [Peptostreptococcaceae bacterium]|nr:hypothetical protein [Peptostreptococcaceae bacterium]
MTKLNLRNDKNSKMIKNHLISTISRRDFINNLSQATVATALLGIAGCAGASSKSEKGLLTNTDDLKINMKQDGSDILFTSDNKLICRIPSTGTGDSKVAPNADFNEVNSKRTLRNFQVNDWDVDEKIELLSPGFYEWQRTWTNHSSEPVKADLVMEIESAYTPEFTLIPGISYNGNAEYGRRAPKGLSSKGEPWIFSAFRSNIPAGNYSEGGGWSIFVFTSLEQSSLYCAFSLKEHDQKLTHRLLWPERDNLLGSRPRGSQQTVPNIEEEITIEPGDKFTVTNYFVLTPVNQKHRSFAAGMDHAWRLNRHDVKPSFPPERLWELGTQFARESLWYDEDDFTGFNIGLQREGDKWVQRQEMRFEIGWCGQNAGWAAILLQDYIRNKNQESLTKGEKALDFWAENGKLPSGLFYTHFDAKLGRERWGVFNREFLGRPLEPGEVFLDTNNLGFGAYYYLLASEFAEEIGLQKPLWRKFGMDMCDFFVENALPDGTFGKAWSLEGKCLQTGFTTGANILWPMVKAYQITGEEKYLETAKRAFRTYVDRDLDQFVCTSGALDADTIDREAGVPLLLAAMDLYEVTGEEEYLRDAELAAYYLASWQWHYALPFHPESPLIKLNYDWFAGTGITVMSQNQDPWGSLWAFAWMRLAEATGKDIWKDRAIQCFNQGTLGISDGTLVFNGLTRPAGSQTESYDCRITESDGKRFYATARDWLVAWPAAHRLTTLMNWPNWKDFEV